RGIMRCLHFWAILLLVAMAVSAQSNYAVLGGTVYDPQQRPIVGATVQVTSQSTRLARQTTSNEKGIFELNALLPGEYELEVRAQGFASRSKRCALKWGSK